VLGSDAKALVSAAATPPRQCRRCRGGKKERREDNREREGKR